MTESFLSRQSCLAPCRDRKFGVATGPWGSWAGFGSRLKFLRRDKGTSVEETKVYRDRIFSIATGLAVWCYDLGFFGCDRGMLVGRCLDQREPSVWL